MASPEQHFTVIESEEERCIGSVLPTLEACLVYYTKGGSQYSLEGVQIMTPTEAIEFIKLTCSVLRSASEENQLQSVLFDAKYDVIATFSLFLTAQLRFLPTTGLELTNNITHIFSDLRLTIVEAIKEIATICRESSEKHLVSMCRAAFVRSSVASGLMVILSAPVASQELRLASAECLFIMCSFLGAESIPVEIFRQILSLAPIEPSSDVRGFICALARQFVEGYPTAPSAIQSISTFIKLTSLDENPDVRALSLGSIDLVLREALSPKSDKDSKNASSSSILSHLPLVPIMEVIISRFETKSEVDEVIEVLCKLLEVTILCACKLHNEEPFKLCARHNLQSHLLASLEKDVHVAYLAAKALRIMLERAPPYLNLTYRLLWNEKTVGEETTMHIRDNKKENLGALLAAVMRTPNEIDDIPSRILGLELAIIVGLILLFSPQNRRHFTRILQNYPSWQESLLTVLHNSLISGSIDYFQDILIVDEAGTVLNENLNIQWKDETQPSQESIQSIVDGQEIRRFNGPAGAHIWSQLEENRYTDVQTGYLAFVLVGYVMFRVMKNPSTNSASPVGEGAATESPKSPSALPSHLDPQHMMQMRQLQTSQHFSALGGSKVEAEGLFSNAGRESEISSTVPMFPNPVRNSYKQYQQTLKMRKKQEEDPNDAVLKNEFDGCLKLTIAFAEHYQRKVKKDDYESVSEGTGMVKRKPNPLKNPWEPPAKQKKTLKLWDVSAVNEGDLFFFQIPLEALTNSVVEVVIAKARKFTVAIKRLYVTTPQNQRNRRHFLDDMITAIMPSIIVTFQRLQKFVFTYTGVQEALSLLPCIRNWQLERCVYCGNLIEIVDYLTHYFAKTVPSKKEALSALGSTAVLNEQANEDDEEEKQERKRMLELQAFAVRGMSPIPKRRDELSALGLSGRIGGPLFPSQSVGSSVSSDSEDIEDQY